MSMHRPSRGTLLLGLVALVIALAQPFVEVIWNCRRGFESSEACVWGKSLLPLTSAVGLILVAPVVFGVLLVIRAAWRTATAKTSPPS
jgi:hypothetical protein